MKTSPIIESIPQVNTNVLSREEFLTTNELMKLLKIKHRQTVYGLIEKGLPKVVVGNGYRFIRQEVINFLKENSKNIDLGKFKRVKKYRNKRSKATP